MSLATTTGQSIAADEIGQILAEELEMPARPIEPREMLADLPGWDSVSMSCVVLAIERHFDVQFSGDELEALSDFGALVTTVEHKRAALRV